ncbi:retrovirus-related Pol polyprotein from transposon 412 [Trichonephila clavipes]|nr:retrovirus-related Pol polyprotein from transposon 412 [Trichonephila clavipes]
MLFGRDIRLPTDLLFSWPPDALLAPEEYIEKLQARMEEMHRLARERISMASMKMKTRYDARATGHDFHEGGKVTTTREATHSVPTANQIASSPSHITRESPRVFLRLLRNLPATTLITTTLQTTNQEAPCSPPRTFNVIRPHSLFSDGTEEALRSMFQI